MRVFIKGKEFTDWKEVYFEKTYVDDFGVRLATHYINQGYDVKTVRNNQILIHYQNLVE